MEIKERIEKIEASLKARQQKIRQLQTMFQNETQAIISLNGGLSELKKLQEDLNKSKETKK